MVVMLLADNYMTAILALIVIGAFAGVLAGLLGVGGGIVIVPVLFFLLQGFGVAADSAIMIATATSLATIVPTSLRSICSHHRRGNVDFFLLRRWAVFILAGSLLGSWLVIYFAGDFLAILFGIIAILSALNMLLRAKNAALFKQLPGITGQGVMAFITGLISAMVGIGGGTVSVPLLVLYKYPMHKAVGTAAAIGLLIALPATLIMLLSGTTPSDAPAGTFGLVNGVAFLCIVPLTVLFAPVGVWLTSQLNAVKLKRIFAIVLLITGIKMLF